MKPGMSPGFWTTLFGFIGASCFAATLVTLAMGDGLRAVVFGVATLVAILLIPTKGA